MTLRLPAFPWTQMDSAWNPTLHLCVKKVASLLRNQSLLISYLTETSLCLDVQIRPGYRHLLPMRLTLPHTDTSFAPFLYFVPSIIVLPCQEPSIQSLQIHPPHSPRLSSWVLHWPILFYFVSSSWHRTGLWEVPCKLMVLGALTCVLTPGF